MGRKLSGVGVGKEEPCCSCQNRITFFVLVSRNVAKYFISLQFSEVSQECKMFSLCFV